MMPGAHVSTLKFASITLVNDREFGPDVLPEDLVIIASRGLSLDGKINGEEEWQGS